MSRSQQITALVGNLSLIVVVGIVAATHNLAGDGEIFWEGIIHHLALFIRIDIHVATVSTAIERTDGAVGKILCPIQSSLDIHLHRLEIEVEQMRIDEWALGIFCWQIQGIDTLVGRVVLPVDRISKVQFLAGIIVIAIQLLELVHEVVVFGCREECFAVAAHEYASDVDVTANLDIHATHGFGGLGNGLGTRLRASLVIGLRTCLCIGFLCLEHGGRVSATVYIALDKHVILAAVTHDIDIHLVGHRSP